MRLWGALSTGWQRSMSSGRELQKCPQSKGERRLDTVLLDTGVVVTAVDNALLQAGGVCSFLSIPPPGCKGWEESRDHCGFGSGMCPARR